MYAKPQLQAYFELDGTSPADETLVDYALNRGLRHDVYVRSDSVVPGDAYDWDYALAAPGQPASGGADFPVGIRLDAAKRPWSTILQQMVAGELAGSRITDLATVTGDTRQAPAAPAEMLVAAGLLEPWLSAEVTSAMASLRQARTLALLRPSQLRPEGAHLPVVGRGAYIRLTGLEAVCVCALVHQPQKNIRKWATTQARSMLKQAAGAAKAAKLDAAIVDRGLTAAKTTWVPLLARHQMVKS